MRIRFLVPARAELNDAITYYSRKGSSLGFRFSDEVKRATKRILQYPQAYPLISETVRHCQIRGFPYSLIYYSRPQEVVIVAVMHHRREPQVWTDRLRNV